MQTDIPRIQKIADAKAFFGEIKNPNAQAMVKKENCGDLSGMQLRIDGGVVREAGYVSYGCGYNLAAHSIICGLVKDKTLDQARALRAEDVNAEAGGFPDHKFHYATQVIELLQKTLDFYDEQQRKAPVSLDKSKFDENREVKCGWTE
ncbi:MAG: iron-sulfur cluster assembly scaffold protein [Planctomycetes bacterium]|nr:iron-sulfur cluster assembly scaffold protein [Planctomycetota bacterium]